MLRRGIWFAAAFRRSPDGTPLGEQTRASKHGKMKPALGFAAPVSTTPRLPNGVAPKILNTKGRTIPSLHPA